jgi:hypothetical protein
MQTIDRRKFLKALVQASGIAMAAVLPADGIARSYSRQEDTSVVASLEAQAWEAFYRRQYGDAEMLFKQLIAWQPSNIKYYKGLSKVYNALNRQDQSAALWLDVHWQYSHLPLFYMEYAIALQSLWMGNPKQAATFMSAHHIKENLLEHAALRYLAALRKWPDNKQLQLGLLDVCHNVKRNERLVKNHKREPVAFSADLQKKIQEATLQAVSFWQTTREDVKYKNTDKRQASGRVSRLTQKPRRELYFKEERQQRVQYMTWHKNKIAYAQCKEALLQQDFGKAEQYTQAIIINDTNSTCALGILKNIYNRQRDYTQLATICRSHAGNTGSAWAYMSLAGALMKQNGASIHEAETIYANVEQATASSRSSLSVSVKQGRANCFRLRRQYEQSLQKLAEALTMVRPETGTATLLLVAYAQTFADKGDTPIAEAILQCMTDKQTTVTDAVPSDMRRILAARQQGIEEYKSRKRGTKKYRRTSSNQERQEGQDWCAHYALAKLQKKQGNHNGLSKTLRTIEQAEPHNRFVRKMRNT